MSDERDDQQPGRPPGQDAAQDPWHGQQAGYTRPYGPTGYGQQYAPPPYGWQPYGGQPYGGQAYGGQPYGGQPFGQHPGQQYGHRVGPVSAADLARPGSVVTASVLGFVYGACGLLMCVLLLAGGAVFGDLVDTVQQTDPPVGGIGSEEVAAARIGLLGGGLVALAWTVVMVWGGALALRGRSRVLLLVGTSVAVAVTGFFALFGILGVAAARDEPGQAGGIVFFLVVFLGTVAMLVLLCLRSAARFFAAHRARRTA